MSVTVVTSCYGTYGRFLERWLEAIDALNPAPDRVIVAGDLTWTVPRADTLSAVCMWQHPQAYYQHFAIGLTDTEWVWLVDADDLVMPDALRGLEDVDADVWQLGFLRSDGEEYLPPMFTNEEYLASDRNVYVGTSMIRTDAYRQVGGFRDVALQDWDLWRRLASNGARFQASDRAHFHYMLHQYRRGETELTLERRPQHLAEMTESLVA